MKVLLSINPEHVDNIFSGVKTFEFRRKVFARKDIKTVVVYCTRPIGMLVGEFDIDSILEDSPYNLWQETKTGSGITKQFFDSYFGERAKAYALKIGEVREYVEPVDPADVINNFTPPQSYMYIDKGRLREPNALQFEMF